jgi:cytidine deaminase
MKTNLSFSYNLTENFSLLSDEHQQLVKAARKATDKAYAPYSRFHVGAAALLSDGTIHTSNNQENAAFPSGVCAEASLITFLSANFLDKEIIALAIAARNAEFSQWLALSPCGNCRQILFEQEKKQSNKILVILPLENERFAVLQNSAVLLPFAFSSDNLAK